MVYGKDSPSCLADYFTWPQVALTHHVCRQPILNHSDSRRVKTGLADSLERLVLERRKKITKPPACSKQSQEAQDHP